MQLAFMRHLVYGNARDPETEGSAGNESSRYTRAIHMVHYLRGLQDELLKSQLRSVHE